MATRTLQIVGAGPAGLAAAIHAVRQGVRAVVREREATVGSRFHDDFQGLENWTSDVDVMEELERAGLAPTFDQVGIREQICFDSNKREFVFRSSTPFYYLVRRGPVPGTLDCALRDQALAAGADIKFGDTVERLPEGGVVARGPRQPNVIAVGYVFDTDAANGCYGVLDDRLAPEGYAYLLIHNGRGTLATCMFRDFHNERVYLERTVTFFQDKVGLKMEQPRRFGGMGTFASGPLLREGHLVFAGEAAGFQDALWGFGMRYALRSGVLAARRLASLGDPRETKRAEQRLQGLYRAGRVNRLLYSRLGNRAYSVFLQLMARASDPRAWLRKRYAPSWWKTLLASFAGATAVSRGPMACEKEACDCTWCRCHRDTGPKRGE